MRLNEDTLHELKENNWFARCGEESVINTEKSIVYVKGFDQIDRMLHSHAGVDYLFENEHDLHGFLDHILSGTGFTNMEWLRVKDHAFDQTNSEIRPIIEDTPLAKTLGTRFIHSVMEDMSYVVMADAFMPLRDRHKNRMDRDLLMIYKEGHFPCGYDEKTDSIYVY